jgi:hypothetical protein
MNRKATANAIETFDEALRAERVAATPGDVRCAIHEAGHAVIAVALGVTIDDASVDATDGFAGHVRPASSQNRRAFRYDRSCRGYTEEAAKRDWAHREAMWSYAGALAECVFIDGHFGRASGGAFERSVDNVAAEADLAEFYPSDPSRAKVRERLKRRTLRMLHRPALWQAVKTVACELMSHRKLDGLEIRLLVAKARRSIRRTKV